MGDISDSQARPEEDILPDLRILWTEDNPYGLECYECGLPFNDEPVIRTFRVLSQGSAYSDELLRASKHITIQSSHILFFDRHDTCLAKSTTKHVAISHVWNRDVSDTQARGAHSPQPASVREAVFSSAMGIAKGLGATAVEPSDEIWHDYFSVPQWTPELKHRILCAIPGVFQRAEKTVVFMDDVSMDMVHPLYHGTTSDERLLAITAICAAAWYKRVWTVLEFVLASSIEVMAQGYQMVDAGDDVFLSKLMEVWDAETAIHGAAHVEDRVRVGTKLVPWNLGPLKDARQRQRMDFASVWILLSRRGCRSIQDFWHALLGLLRAEIPTGGLDLSGDPLVVCMEIMKSCLMQGDYSPLLMTPMAEPYDRRGEWRQMTRDGFNDVNTFGLGPQTSGPELHCGLKVHDGQPLLKFARMGRVAFVSNSPRHPDAMSHFATVFQIVLGFTGPDPEAFATTVCSRLYFVPLDEVSALLSSQTDRDELHAILQHQYNSPPDSTPSPSTTSRLASLLHLTQRDPSRPETTPPLTFLQMHGGTIHMGWFGGLIGVTCETCHGTFLYRAAFYKSASVIRGCVAYRIPGLEYPFARKDGVGILVDGQRQIVGRMVWATPACACEVEKVMVAVEVPDFYGVVTGEWVQGCERLL